MTDYSNQMWQDVSDLHLVLLIFKNIKKIK